MAPNEHPALGAAKARYEAHRRSTALARAAAVAVLVLALAGLEHVAGLLRQQVVFAAGTALFALVYFSSVQGGVAFRGVRAGLLFGVLPLAAALAAESVGMVCTPAGCSSLCGPVCAVAGVAAALLVARTVRGAQATPKHWLMAGGALVATGALGCACVHYTGVIALTIAVSAALTTVAVLRPRAA